MDGISHADLLAYVDELRGHNDLAFRGPDGQDVIPRFAVHSSHTRSIAFGDTEPVRYAPHGLITHAMVLIDPVVLTVYPTFNSQG